MRIYLFIDFCRVEMPAMQIMESIRMEWLEQLLVVWRFKVGTHGRH